MQEECSAFEEVEAQRGARTGHELRPLLCTVEEAVATQAHSLGVPPLINGCSQPSLGSQGRQLA